MKRMVGDWWDDSFRARNVNVNGVSLPENDWGCLPELQKAETHALKGIVKRVYGMPTCRILQMGGESETGTCTLLDVALPQNTTFEYLAGL